MVVDCFLLFNELDLLEIRLNILNDVVDKFVICEAKETFQGKSKPLYYRENKERFAKWQDKIIHYVIEDISEEEKNKARLSPNVGAGEHWWIREYCQKESMLKALTFCQDDDIIFISDLDEIWNSSIEIKADDKVYRPKQTAYHYFLNNRSDQDINGWVGTRFGTYKTLKRYGINHFRTEREVRSILIENGGWHFTFMGGVEAIKEKVESYGHQEYNTDYIKNNIQNCVDRNIDFANRGFNLWKDESGLPEYLLKNKEKYAKLFRQ